MLTSKHPLGFALNHVTVPRLAWRDMVQLAARLGCNSVEFRGDLGRDMFDGDTAETVRLHCANLNVRVIALAEVAQFNTGTKAVMDATRALAARAQAVGSDAIILIPQVGGSQIGFDQLCGALHGIGDILSEFDLRGLVEPIGFQSSTLRSFDLARQAIKETHGAARFGIVHDTFHHFLSDETSVDGDLVDLIHVSGVSAAKLSADFADEDRHLVTETDRLGTIEQLKALIADGVNAPISFESFCPQTQSDTAPFKALADCITFISDQTGANMPPARNECRTALTGAPV